MPWIFWLALAAAGSIGGASGGLVALVVGEPLTDGWATGVVSGLCLMVLWSLWTGGLLAVMSLTGQQFQHLSGRDWDARRRRWWDK